MKKELLSNKKHELMSPIASMQAQLALLKRSKDYEHLSEDTKGSLNRLEENLQTLHLRLKVFLEEVS